MSVHHPNRHHEGDGIKLIGNPTELVELMFPGKKEQGDAMYQIENEGPMHKQVFNSLLLNRFFRLVKTIEKNSGEKFVLQEGYELTKTEDGNEVTIPVEIPINLGTDLEKKQIADAIAHAPLHEMLIYAMSLQVIEWAITATEKQIKG